MKSPQIPSIRADKISVKIEILIVRLFSLSFVQQEKKQKKIASQKSAIWNIKTEKNTAILMLKWMSRYEQIL